MRKSITINTSVVLLYDPDTIEIRVFLREQGSTSKEVSERIKEKKKKLYKGVEDYQEEGSSIQKIRNEKEEYVEGTSSIVIRIPYEGKEKDRVVAYIECLDVEYTMNSILVRDVSEEGCRAVLEDAKKKCEFICKEVGIKEVELKEVLYEKNNNINIMSREQKIEVVNRILMRWESTNGRD